jgi:hypothetical protein
MESVTGFDWTDWPDALEYTICFHVEKNIVETRCSATGILGRHAAVALMTGCEALLTMYRGSQKM